MIHVRPGHVSQAFKRLELMFKVSTLPFVRFHRGDERRELADLGIAG